MWRWWNKAGAVWGDGQGWLGNSATNIGSIISPEIVIIAWGDPTGSGDHSAPKLGALTDPSEEVLRFSVKPLNC